jgi:hypothetical protein
MTYIEKIVDTVKGEVTEKPYTKEQLDETKVYANLALAEKVSAEAKATAKAAAQAKLAALGLTVEDLTALGL